MSVLCLFFVTQVIYARFIPTMARLGMTAISKALAIIIIFKKPTFRWDKFDDVDLFRCVGEQYLRLIKESSDITANSYPDPMQAFNRYIMLNI